MSYVPKISPNLLTPYNHALFLIDYESQMLFPLKSINTGEFRDNVGIVAGASKIFEVPTVVTTVAEESFSGPVFPELEEFYPKATSNHIDRTSMNAWEDEHAYSAITKTSKKKIVFGGLWTSVCIVDPVLCAITEGYETYVITDACGDVSLEAHEQAINRMVQAGATPMTSIQYLLELQRDWARQETYAAVTDLVKKYGGSYGIGIQYAQRMHAH
jgi:nicotinamidase-related amidase